MCFFRWGEGFVVEGQADTRIYYSYCKVMAIKVVAKSQSILKQSPHGLITISIVASYSVTYCVKRVVKNTIKLFTIYCGKRSLEIRVSPLLYHIFVVVRRRFTNDRGHAARVLWMLNRS